MEAAAARRIAQVGRRAGDSGQPRQRPAQRRERLAAAPAYTDAAGLRRAARPARSRRPRPAYMIAIRSANSSSSDRSCVMKSTAKPEVAFERLDLLQDLALDDDVERRRRLVHDDQLGLERERHRDDHALAHAARELVRVCAHAPPVDADELEQLARPRERASLGRCCSCARIASTNWSPTRITGLSAFIALWQTRSTRCASGSAAAPRRSCRRRSSPSKRMLPPAIRAGGRRICIDRVRDRASCRSPTRPRARRSRPRESRGRRRRPPGRASRRSRTRPSSCRSSSRSRPRACRDRSCSTRLVTPPSRGPQPPADEHPQRPRSALLGPQARVADLVDPGEQQDEAEHGERERARPGRRTATTRPAAPSSSSAPSRA